MFVPIETELWNRMEVGNMGGVAEHFSTTTTTFLLLLFLEGASTKTWGGWPHSSCLSPDCTFPHHSAPYIYIVPTHCRLSFTFRHAPMSDPFALQHTPGPAQPGGFFVYELRPQCHHRQTPYHPTTLISIPNTFNVCIKLVGWLTTGSCTGRKNKSKIEQHSFNLTSDSGQ
jgi:hypothetical protein